MPTLNLHDANDLVTIFNSCFKENYNTELVFGEDEPIYLPAKSVSDTHKVVFAYGYFASALHEIAHWCIAGEKRRLLEDYGYWYNPDGRTVQQQKEFEKVEIKPQALEWAFSCAANFKFNISVDNLNGDAGDSTRFKQAVYRQLVTYYPANFPTRAQTFISALCNYYRQRRMFELPLPLAITDSNQEYLCHYELA